MKRFVAASAGGALLALALAGCSGGVVTVRPASASTPEPTGTASGTPSREASSTATVDGNGISISAGSDGVAIQAGGAPAGGASAGAVHAPAPEGDQVTINA